MIELPLVGGGTLYINPDYVIELKEVDEPQQCKLVEDHPDGVREYVIAQSIRRTMNELNRFF